MEDDVRQSSTDRYALSQAYRWKAERDKAMQELRQLKKEAEGRLMPEGMEWLLDVWPKWSNGEYCKFGDWWTADKYGEHEPKQLRRLVFYTPEQLREWEQDEGDNFGYEWNFMRPSDTTYRPDKAASPAPKALAADGEPLEVGQTVWDTNGDELVVGAIEDGGHTVTCRYADVGDGIPVHGMWSPSDLTHTKPEPPDSAERIAEDIRRMAEEWCSHPTLSEASEKAAGSVGEATMGVALGNLSKRCRALAERERGE